MSKSITETTKFRTYTFGGKPVANIRVEREAVNDTSTVPVKVGSHLILSFDRSGSMYGKISEVKATLRKVLTLSEFNDPSLMVSLISYSSQGDVKTHFKRVPVSEVMRTDSAQLREIDSIQATSMTCISQSLVVAETLVNDAEVTCITLHTDGFANDNSPSSEARAIAAAITSLKKHPKLFVNAIAHGDYCDFGLLANISNSLSGTCVQARNNRQVYESIAGTMALLAGTVAPAVELAKGGSDMTLFVSRSAKKVLGSSDGLLVQGLASSDDKTGYRLYFITDEEYNRLNVPVNGDGASVEPIVAYARAEIARGNLNKAKYAMTALRNGDLLTAHAKALVSSEVAALAEALEAQLFTPTAYTPLATYGLPSTGPSVLTVLDTLNTYRQDLQIDLKDLAAGYKRRGVRKVPGVRKDDGSLEAPTVESRYREASDSFVQINGFELNRDTATGNLLVSQPIDLFRTADNTKIASVEEVDLTSMRSFNNYTIVGDGTLNVSSLRLRASDKRAHRALRDLGLAIGDYTPNAPFTVDMSTLPLVDYDTTFDTVDPATVRNLARLTVLSKILAGLTKGQSVSLTDAQVAALKGVYVSASLNFSPPTTNEYADLQVALATGKVDTRLSYKILVGIPELTSVTKLASGNAYLQRRFTATQGATKVDKPTLDMVTTTGVTFAIKKLTAATKLDTVDEIAYPIYEGFLGLGDQTEVQNVLKLAGCTNPATFLAEVRSGNRERIVETVKEGQALVDAAIEGIYAKVRPLAFYVGASGIVPDTLGAVAMTGEDFATKYPTAKLAKDEKEEGTFFVLPNGTVLTVYVKGEYFSTAAATTPQN